MAPRFVNPHFLPESSTLVSRKDIYVDKNDYTSDEETHNADSGLIGQLNTLIRKVLEPSGVEERSRKRRKIQVDSPTSVEEEEEPIPFRLVSSSQPPHPILLQPKPLPPPITREPESEDNEVQAALRMERAHAAAVDASRILMESRVSIHSLPRDTRKLKQAIAALLTSPPVIMILEHSKPSRPTRPPVPASHLSHHPYNDGPILPTNSPGRSMDCPVVLATLMPSNPITSTRRRRRRAKMLLKERPPAAFWRPNPVVGGKSLGYAMGFPCSVEALQSGGDNTAGYQRDTMGSCQSLF